MAKFSIITICLNMETEIADTITSVLNQTNSDFEYLVKDGVSSDRTLDIAQSFVSAFAEKGISYRIISIPDGGIYDAMNQAVEQAEGEWLVFMNAGDCFASETVLEQVDNSGCLEEADVVFGDRILKKDKLFFYEKPRPLESIRVSLPFGHQCSFTNRSLFEENLFSVRYKICGDHRFYLQQYRAGKKFVYCPCAIAIYDTTGISSNAKLLYPDEIQMLEEMPVRDEEAIQKLRKRMKKKRREEFWHRHLWRYIPQKLRTKRRETMRKNVGWKTEEEFFGQEKENP